MKNGGEGHLLEEKLGAAMYNETLASVWEQGEGKRKKW
jgi:hypothetical protein